MPDETAIRELVEKMAEERGKLIDLFEALTEEEAERAPEDAEGEAQWTAKEQCAHLAEMETAYRGWVELALVEENPDLSGGRGKQVAIPLEQANQHPVSELVAELRDQRERTSAFIDQLQPEQLERTATQAMFGTLTVLQWLRSYYRHDRMHQAQLAGRVSDFQPRFATGSEPDQRRVRIQ